MIDFELKTQLRFKNKTLLTQALTHSSYAKFKQHHGLDNERLEFFGDAVLKLIVSEYLFNLFPNANEGRLTQIRAQIVSDKNLALLAQHIDLGDFLLFSHGEKKSGGNTKISNLANAFEALLGAYFLDSGLESVRQFFIPLLEKHSSDLLNGNCVDNKTVLQEWLQKKKLPLPTYTVKQESGPDHQKEFLVEVAIPQKGNVKRFEGRGKSKKEAEQMAAQKAVETLFRKKSTP